MSHYTVLLLGALLFAAVCVLPACSPVSTRYDRGLSGAVGTEMRK